MPALKAIRVFPESQKFRHFRIFPAHHFFTLSENLMPPPDPAPTKAPIIVFWTLNALLGVAFLIEISLPNFSGALDAAVIVLAAAAGVAALHRRLPLQNVLLAALVTALIGGVAHGLSARTGFPFGPIVFDLQSGTPADVLNRKTEITLNPVIYEKQSRMLLFHTVPWTVPLLWVTAVFCSRGMGRLILRPWRKVKNYGFWLIGLTALLAMTFDFALEPYAVSVKHWWHWQKVKINLTWHGASPLNFIGWGCVTLFLMMFITPSLIKKQPGRSRTPDFQPLVVWLGALALFAVGSAGAGLWGATSVDAVIAAVTTVFAVRGAKW